MSYGISVLAYSLIGVIPVSLSLKWAFEKLLFGPKRENAIEYHPVLVLRNRSESFNIKLT